MNTISTADLYIRDPFILPWHETKTYYLYSSGTLEDGRPCFCVYRSQDLQTWEGPIPAFTPPADFWATKNYWAPECHVYQGRLWLFGSLYSDKHNRGTQIFVADHPEGPFTPISDGPVTPAEWMALDGTLWLEPDGQPWIVFCHEWLQIKDGTIEAMPLTADLTRPAGPPQTLFHGSDAYHIVTKGIVNPKGYVTDGPFLFHRDGELFMLWSTCDGPSYCQIAARSLSGRVTGPWEQLPTPLYTQDGGHGMRFVDFDGTPRFVLHAPNSKTTRMRFLPDSALQYAP